MGKPKKSTVPRKASRGMGASHRRHGTGGGMRSKVGVLWRPPDGAKRRRGALAELNRRFKGCECDIEGTCSEHRERKVESMRGKRVERAATHRVNIASHGSKGSFILNDGIRSYGWLDELLDKIPAKITIIIDSCYSGSALPHLGQPGREVYVACGADELSTGEYDRRFAEALGGVEADVDGDGIVEIWEADWWGRGMKWTLGNGIAIRSDYDKDGLADDLEQNDSFWESLGVPENEFPDWETPDIYVEVDWMEGHKPNCLGIWTSYPLWAVLLSIPLFLNSAASFIGAGLCFSGIITSPLGVLFLIIAILYLIGGLALLAATAEETSLKAIFNEHDVNLHIDSGGMGGGGSINDYKKDITYSMEKNLYDNKGLDGTKTSGNRGFDNSRYGIFHYCIISNYIEGKTTRGRTHGTRTNDGGDFFCLAGGRISGTSAWGHVFNHELGHNILGILDPDHRSKSDSSQNTIHSRWSTCVMYESNTDGGDDGDPSTLGHRSEDKYLDYHSNLWTEISRDGLKIVSTFGRW